MNELDTPSILAVGAKLANLARADLARASVARAEATGDAGTVRHASLAEVGSGREAFDLMRVVQFDLVAIGSDVSDMAMSQLVQRIRQAKPWQKWLLVADAGLAERDEIVARSLGAVAIVEGPDVWKDVYETAVRLRRSSPQTRVPGLSLNSAQPRPAAMARGRRS